MSKFETRSMKNSQMSDKSDNLYGFDVETVSRIEPYLRFLYEKWWKVEFFGLDRVPVEGPCLIVGNQGSILPWQALMLGFALMNQKPVSRRLFVLMNMDSIKDKKLARLLGSIGFVDWSSANMKDLFEKDCLVAIFPEGVKGLTKPFKQRYRLEPFDWTMLLPAVESGVEILPMAALGFDEACPQFFESRIISSLIKLSNYSIPQEISWLPSPLSLLSCPVEVSLNLLKPAAYKNSKSRDEIESETRSVTLWIEGEIQADLNRQLRHRGA